MELAIAAAAGLVIAIAIGAAAGWRHRRRPPVALPADWLWEGIELEPLPEPHDQAGSAATLADGQLRGQAPRLIVRGRYMARPSILHAAPSDWAFATQPTPFLVLVEVATGEELLRASLDRIRNERLAIVDGLSISHALPSPLPPQPDAGRREGAPFAIDVGFYLPVRAAPWTLRIHAELGPLRATPVEVQIRPRNAPPA